MAFQDSIWRPKKSIALIGFMGAGKSTVGRRLAERLDVNFVDSDTEIELAAGLTVSEIFELYGEAEFRRGEKRVIERLTNGPLSVIALGGGAYMDGATRQVLQKHTYTVWLKVSIDILWERVSRNNKRPLLQRDNPRAFMEELLAKRAPIYQEAMIHVETDASPHQNAVQSILSAVQEHENQLV